MRRYAKRALLVKHLAFIRWLYRFSDPGRRERRNGIACDVRARHVHRDDARQSDQARFGRRISRLSEIADQSRAGHDLDYTLGRPALLLLFPQVQSRRGQQPERNAQVGRQDLVPVLAACLENKRVPHNGRIIDHDIDRAVNRQRSLHSAFRCAWLRQVFAKRCSACTEFSGDRSRDCRIRLPAGNAYAAIGDQHRGAAAMQFFNNCEADAARAAGNQGNPSGEALICAHCMLAACFFSFAAGKKASAWMSRNCTPRSRASALAASTIAGGPAKYTLNPTRLAKSSANALVTRPCLLGSRAAPSWASGCCGGSLRAPGSDRTM